MDEIKLTKEDRESLEDWYANYLVDSIEWYKPRIIYEICRVGFIGSEQMDDTTLFEEYADYILSYELTEDDAKVPIKIEEAKEGTIVTYVGGKSERETEEVSVDG